MAIGLKLLKGIAFTKALNNEEIILPGVSCAYLAICYILLTSIFFICFSEFLVRISQVRQITSITLIWFVCWYYILEMVFGVTNHTCVVFALILFSFFKFMQRESHDHLKFSAAGRAFLYLPFEHSEDRECQVRPTLAVTFLCQFSTLAVHSWNCIFSLTRVLKIFIGI